MGKCNTEMGLVENSTIRSDKGLMLETSAFIFVISALGSQAFVLYMSLDLAHVSSSFLLVAVLCYLSFGLSFTVNTPAFTVLFGANVKLFFFTWLEIRLKRRGIMKRKQHLQFFLSVCNKRLLSATARHA